MTRAGLRLSVSRALKIHRGEESRILAFFVLHVLLSLVIGMISSVVDALVITRQQTGSSAMLYSVSATALGAIGLFYAGITDRIDKRRLFFFSLVVSLAICLLAGFLLFLHDFIGGIPLLVSGLFVWRFIVGILLLLIFWDLAPFFFDARQGKRLFPLLAIGGAMGYSGGSLLVVALVRFVPLSTQLFAIALVTLLCVVTFQHVRTRFTILDSPRYRDRTIREELREGFETFRSNPFLRAVGGNTVLFGILSGLIILTYNAVIDARTTTGSEAASLMGIQRAGATVLQAVILTKVMSQSALGGKHKNAVIMQLGFFTLGIVAFAISMVGVADFTRQIEVALMSPAAMAAFAFLPSRYRGRVMVLNNIVAASLGILAATIVVQIAAPYVDPLWFIYPIGALMVIRLAFNFVLDRRYVALLSESLLSDNKLNLARIEENTGSILQDQKLLDRLYRQTREQSPSIRMFMAGRLARSARTAEDIERVQPFLEMDGQANEALQALRIQTLARVDFEQFEPEITRAVQSSHGSVRIASRLAILTRRVGEDPERESDRLLEEFRRLSGESDTGPFAEVCELILRLEAKTNLTIIGENWHELRDSQREIFLRILADNPTTYYFSTLVEQLSHETLRDTALKGLKKLPEELLLEKREQTAHLEIPLRLLLLREMHHTHPLFARSESEEILGQLLKDLPMSNEIELFAALHDKGEQITDAALLVLSDPKPPAAPLARMAEERAAALGGLFPMLFLLRFDTPGLEQQRYLPLFRALLEERLHELSLLVLTLSAVALAKENDRVLAWSVCRELRDRTSPVQQNALEFVETRTEEEIKKYLLLFFESLTDLEKQARLRPLVRNYTFDTDRKLSDLHSFYLSRDAHVPAEIIGSLRFPRPDPFR
ncbi:MAG: hypothetical protein EA427_08545 [Spirochaetaceae bacterium]|nr:MAG: hypothetical protein EA427_08545 [Spirochaetaceae bacterium]